MQNIASKTVTGQYGSSTVLQQVNDQLGQQCKFLGVHTRCFVWSSASLTVVGMVQNWGVLGVVRVCKLLLSVLQTSIC